jgi:hypothetical protein
LTGLAGKGRGVDVFGGWRSTGPGSSIFLVGFVGRGRDVKDFGGLLVAVSSVNVAEASSNFFTSDGTGGVAEGVLIASGA